jgi:predicted DNA-binding transcriptional regulator AlpA
MEQKRVERKLSRRKELAERKIIRRPRVRELTGYSDTTIWRLEKKDEFPLRIQLSPMAVGWFEDEVLEWLRMRVRGMGRQPPLPKARRRTEAAAE